VGGVGQRHLKYDWCAARNIYTDDEMQAVYQKMGDALRSTGRPIVYSLCQYGNAEVWKWGPDVGGNLWRTTGDIRDQWTSMIGIVARQVELADYARPGHWNDPDMLEIGNGGMSEIEYQAHMGLWSVLAAPLRAGNDLRDMPPSIKAILTNEEVIAVNQDKDGKQGRRLWNSGDQEIWVRELTGGGKAVALFNRGEGEAKVSAHWSDVKMSKPTSGRDVWAHKDVIFQGSDLSAMVPGHGVVMWVVR